ncbi:serine/threonine protein kinase [Emergomyces africanus]|uniref:Serine/threonine protein kinase n=1 Tax=Emergomyces africanus TaxID=1955775 RepID=A0A1B7NT79_9EURO|nr:serine/threonine protein kinase [Emergomyces africanus]
MPPQITAWEDLAFFHEEVDETGEFQHTTFAVINEDDSAYFGKLNLLKRNITFLQLTSTLTPISGNDIFPPYNMELTQAQEPLPPNTYIKRPNLSLYDIFQEYNVLNLISKDLLEEAQVMEKISEHPHPNIINYHGCRVRRGCITGLVLDHHSNTLTDYLKNKIGPIDKKPFLQALKSAIYHLHSLGWAHNDLKPDNILVDKDGMPVLIDFGATREIGAKLGTSRGTKGWIDREMKDYHTSDKHHDLYALEKICKWLDAPIFDN